MSNKEILIAAIDEAKSNGWDGKPDPYGDTSVFELIFNHDFAKAIWGDNVYFTVYLDMWGNRTTKDDPKGKKGHSNGLPKWQYRLQQMVIADDPIAYLGQHLTPTHPQQAKEGV